jgi:hypothetical protein
MQEKANTIYGMAGNSDVPRLGSYQKTGVKLTNFEEEVVGP